MTYDFKISKNSDIKFRDNLNKAKNFFNSLKPDFFFNLCDENDLIVKEDILLIEGTLSQQENKDIFCNLRIIEENRVLAKFYVYCLKFYLHENFVINKNAIYESFHTFIEE